MGKKLPYLHPRGRKLGIRRRVPEKLQPIIGKSEIWKSLGTGDYDLAREIYFIENGKIEQLFAHARRSLDTTEPKADVR